MLGKEGSSFSTSIIGTHPESGKHIKFCEVVSYGKTRQESQQNAYDKLVRLGYYPLSNNHEKTLYSFNTAETP